MIMLFRSGTYVCPCSAKPYTPYPLPSQPTNTVPNPRFREKIWLIFRATRTHARNLAKFAVIYKATCALLRRFGQTPGKEGMPTILSPPYTPTHHRRNSTQAPTTASSPAFSAGTSSSANGPHARAKSPPSANKSSSTSSRA